MKIVHGEIEYINKQGASVHSDVCPPDHDFEKINKEYRDFLHEILDEWLDESGGSGGFYIKAEEHDFWEE
jgi:hypothetical protein